MKKHMILIQEISIQNGEKHEIVPIQNGYYTDPDPKTTKNGANGTVSRTYILEVIYNPPRACVNVKTERIKPLYNRKCLFFVLFGEDLFL